MPPDKINPSCVFHKKPCITSFECTYLIQCDDFNIKDMKIKSNYIRELVHS